MTRTLDPTHNAAPASVGLLWRVIPPGLYGGKASMLVERAALVNRRAWFVLIGGAFEPILFLWSLGLGFGQFVTSVAGPDGQPVSYAAFVAPALLAASAMNGAV